MKKACEFTVQIVLTSFITPSLAVRHSTVYPAYVGIKKELTPDWAMARRTLRGAVLFSSTWIMSVTETFLMVERVEEDEGVSRGYTTGPNTQRGSLCPVLDRFVSA